MNGNECEQGRRVWLLADLDGGRYKAGDTGYLNKGGWEGAEWGVVFDRDADNDMMTTNVQLETLDGRRVRVIAVVEPIEPESDDEIVFPGCYACGWDVTGDGGVCGHCGADIDANGEMIELSEDTRELTPVDVQLIEAANEMELIRQLATAHHELESATIGNKITFTALIGLNEKRESAIKALIAYCRERWLSDPVYAPIGGD